MRHKFTKSEFNLGVAPDHGKDVKVAAVEALSSVCSSRIANLKVTRFLRPTVSNMLQFPLDTQLTPPPPPSPLHPLVFFSLQYIQVACH